MHRDLEAGREGAYQAEMITSRLSSEAQTTVPQAVRIALGLKPGDKIAYRIEQGRVVLTKDATAVMEDQLADCDEWHSAADVQAYEEFIRRRLSGSAKR
jgi:antitoxin PrlF